MGGKALTTILSDTRTSGAGDLLPLSHVIGLLDTVERSLLVSERSGRVVLANSRARKCLESVGMAEYTRMNLFTDILEHDSKKIFTDIEGGEHEVKLDLQRGEKRTRASIRWMPEPDWLLVEFELPKEAQSTPDPATQITVQELLQEREITYRNLLAAYLRLQEVNRQKTVFLASAAHELENASGGHQGLLRSFALRFARPSVGKAARHSGGVEGELRAAGAPRFDVPQLLRARKRQVGSATPRKRSARLPG